MKNFPRFSPGLLGGAIFFRSFLAYAYEATNIADFAIIVYYINDYCYYVANIDSPTSSIGPFFREISLSWLSNRERYLIINAYMNRSRRVRAAIKPALVDRAFTRSDIPFIHRKKDFFARS
jgi:hypothetical protein